MSKPLLKRPKRLRIGTGNVKIRNRKLSKDAIEELRRIPIDVCKPFDVLMTPVYVYLPNNGKFVSIKLPLQVFSQQEIDKYKPYESFYLPQFVDQIAPFQKAGESIRALLDVSQQRPVRTSEGDKTVTLSMPQHELDDSVLHLVGPLWNAGAEIEAFFLCFLANEVCMPFSANVLSEAVETNSDLFELALLRSSTAVFLALHIGYSNARTLTLLREKIFSDTMKAHPASSRATEIGLLQSLIQDLLPTPETQKISLDLIRELMWKNNSGGKVSRKLLSRLERVLNQFVQPDQIVASLFGERGICDE
jgi:hypothetical protein